MRPLQPIIPVQSPPRFNEIINPIKITTPKSSREVLNLYRKMCAADESFQASATRLLFRKVGRALDIANAKLAESKSRYESFSDLLKKARPKKRKAVEMKVQGTFVQMMDVRKVKISMGVQLEPPSPVPVKKSVEEDERESSTAKDEIVVGELLSDAESGSNYSDGA
jgi:predicted CopG family antitoxin